MSEITDLEMDEIMHKYTMAHITPAQQKKLDRKKVQDRLYGIKRPKREHHCATCAQRPASAEPKKVKMELREITDGVSMCDESNSAHQFSMYNISIQADAAERLEVEMQTSAIEHASNGD